MPMRLCLATFVWAAALAGCATLPHPGPLDAERAVRRWPEVTLATLQAGRKMYVAKCSGCHSLRSPSSKPADTWPSALDEMEQDGDLTLTRSERLLIEQFLVTMSEAPLATAQRAP